MSDSCFFDRLKRKIIVTGHYGSGKTEFAVSLAKLLKSRNSDPKTKDDFNSVSIIDLDIVNPYFRSREQRVFLENEGISVYGSVYKKEVTAELPALGASLRAPLESDSCRVIVDAGGNDTGALVLNQFTKYFIYETDVLAVINANRPDTSTFDTALEHIRAIERITALTISGLINNTHLLRETTCADIIKGYALCEKISEATGKSLLCNCYPQGLIDTGELSGLSGSLMPMGLYMRPTWLDK